VKKAVESWYRTGDQKKNGNSSYQYEGDQPKNFFCKKNGKGEAGKPIG